MKYIVYFDITKGYAEVEVDAENEEEAKDIAWHDFLSMTVGELKKMEVDVESDTE